MDFFYFFLIFLAWKMKIKKKWIKCLEISLFYISIPKIMMICYTVPEIWCMTDVIVIFHFGLFFALLQPKKSKLYKNKKNTWRYDHFIYVCHKFWSDDVRFLRYGVRRTDGRKDGQKGHIEVGPPPKKTIFFSFWIEKTQYTNFWTL